MAEKFQNKYRISSARLQTWNYGLAGSYFVTVCTDNREHFFGEIVDGKMVLSAIGEIVENEWIKTLEIRPDMNLELDAFCVMPNHFHAIIIIGNNQFNDRRDAMHRVSTTGNQFAPQSKNLSSIMRGFKSSVTVAARSIDNNFKWQPRFHDHIIRNNVAFQRIRKYIIENPQNWLEDRFYN